MLKKLKNLFNKQVIKEVVKEVTKYETVESTTVENVNDVDDATKNAIQKHIALMHQEFAVLQTEMKINKSGMALDSTSYANTYSDYAGYIDFYNDPLLYKNLFKSFNLLGIYASVVPEIENAIINWKADILRKGFRFTIPAQNEKNTNDKEKIISILDTEWKKFNCNEILDEVIHKTLAMGGCQIYPRFKNVNAKKLKDRLFISENTISEGLLSEFRVLEPLKCLPLQTNMTDPLGLKTDDSYYEPTLWSVLGTDVHKSRLIKCVFEPIATQSYKQVYAFYGKSLTDKIISASRNFQEISDITVEIAKMYNLLIVKGSLLSKNMGADLNSEITKSMKTQSIIQRLKILANDRKNKSVLFLDKENEDFNQIQINLSGLSDLVRLHAEIICMRIQMPVSKFLGSGTGGFSKEDGTGEAHYYDKIDGIRTKYMRTIILKMAEILLLNAGHKWDEAIDVDFNKLKETDQLEQAQINEINSRTDTNYLNAGVVNQDEIRTKIIMTDDNHYDMLEANEDMGDE